MWGRGDEDGTDDHIRPDWDEYGLSLAQAAATRADCTRRKVGAILMASDHSIVGSGYNGGPSKGPSCLKGECPRGRLTHEQLPADSPYDSGGGKCVALHAEWNLLLRSSWAEMNGATLYITEEPCHICKVLIGGTQIARIVWPMGELIPDHQKPQVICDDWADGHSYRKCTKPKGHTDPHG